MTRTRIVLLHLVASGVVAAALWFLVLFFWYPDGFLSLQGGANVLLWVTFITFILGPLLSFIATRSSKKSSREFYFDFILILLLQIGSFAYGAWVLSFQRVEYLVFLHDRFFVMSPNNVVGEVPPEIKKANPAWLRKPVPVFVRLSLGAQLEIARTIEGLVEPPPMAFLGGAYTDFSDGLWRLEQIIASNGAGVRADGLIGVPIVGRERVKKALLEPDSGQFVRIE